MQDQFKERKYVADMQSSRLNSDDGEDFVGLNEYVNLSCFRSGSTDKGITGTLESIGSNTLLSTPLVSQTFLTIGSAADIERKRIIYFDFCTTGPWHRIVCWDITLQQELIVLLSSQVNGGLNFSKYSNIHSVRVIEGKLYWVDGTNNQPRNINIDSALVANNPSYDTNANPYTFPIEGFEITLIKPPPALAPNIQKDTDAGFENNFIANDSVMFCYRYKGYDNWYTVLGTYSPSSRLNSPNATENSIIVTMDVNEVIPQSARYVELIVRYSNSNNAFVIKTWDKEIAADAQEIQDQNDATVQLTFTYYGNITGEAIPNGLDSNGQSIPGLVNHVLKPFDSVPIFSQTLEAAKNKLLLANNTAGYDTPTTTSLNYFLTETDTTTVNLRKPLIDVRISFGITGPAHGYSAWYVFLTQSEAQGQLGGYYEITSTAQFNNSIFPPTPMAAPGFVAFGSLTWRGATQDQVVAYVRTTTGATGIQVANTFNTLTDPITGYTNITGLTISVYDFFKTRSQYQIAIVFYDRYLRRCGVLTNDGLLIEIPTREFSFSTGTSGIVWTLSNDNALNEIPDWAYYYSIVRTLNLKTRFFIQSYTNAAKYATKDADGNYQFTSNTFVVNAAGIGLNTGAIVQSGLGYGFSPGDVAVLIRDDNTVFEIPVIGQDGSYIIVAAQDIGPLSGEQFIFEIYTPYQRSTQEPFFEVGNMYRVLNPTTSARQYDTLSDILLPDAYLLSRNYSGVDYFAEGMSPNDLFWQNWFNDGGKANLITTLGQSVKTSSISFSNNFIPDTQINGLNTFDVIDEASMPGNTPIRKLQLTSKIQEELGSVMLAICETQVISMYIGEVQQYGSTGRSANIVTSEQVIGTVNVLKGNYGTVDPESVTEYRGNVWFLDAINGKYIQYDLNGLGEISKFKMTRFWGQWCQQYLSMTKQQIEAFGDRPYVYSIVDPYHGELLISIPKLSDTPPKGYLPDYTEDSYVKDAIEIRQGYFVSDDAPPSYYYGIFVYLTETQPNGYYLIPSTQAYSSPLPPPSVSPPASINQSELVFKGSTIDEVLENTMPIGATRFESSSTDTGSDVTIIGVRNLAIYPFDILDFQGKTIVYQLDKGQGFPKWMGSYPFVTENFVTLLNKLYSFKSGLLYIHNQTTTYNQFYGVPNRSRVMLVFNQGQPLERIFNNIAIKSNLQPTYVYGYVDTPYQQCTDLVDFDFSYLGGIWYATFYRNKLQPTAIGYDQDKLLTGEKMRSAAMFILIEFEVSTQPAELEYVSIGSSQTHGQAF